MTEQITRQQAAGTAVIGAGIVGAAVARALARRGETVTILESNRPGHELASSKGDARIRVLAAYPDEEYLRLGLDSDRLWRELETETGRRMLHPTGAISYGSDAERLAGALAAHEVEHELMGREEAARRAPAVNLPEGIDLFLWQPDGAILAAEAGLEAMLGSAASHGARLIPGQTVKAVRQDGDEVTVQVAEGQSKFARAIVVAGAWTASLLGWPELSGLRPTAQTVSYFRRDGPPLPAVIDYDGAEPYSGWTPGFGLKTADHELGPAIEPGRLPGPDPERVAASTAWVAERFGMEEGPAMTETCVYTNTPDERFLIESKGSVTAVSACNGQGFQLSPAVGEMVARRMLRS
ncbi:MAG: FAD-dependent oxidoreductase [Solirubrobacterales bacterium]|nr:FAD-dependent oxidoreductase [Solirubrobacterales bacterium]